MGFWFVHGGVMEGGDESLGMDCFPQVGIAIYRIVDFFCSMFYEKSY